LLTKLVAYLAHPYLDLPHEMTKLQLNREEEHQIFDLSKSNKVLLRTVSYDGCKKFLIKSGIISELVNRSSVFKDSYNYALSLKQELLNVIAKFNERSIDTIFIKSLNTLPLDSDNFDILVKERDLAASIKMLKEAGFVKVAWVREPYKSLFRYVRDGKDYLAVHLHTAVAWEGTKYVDVDNLWKEHRKLEIDGVAVGMPSPETHLLITFAHAFFENHQFSLNDLTYIVEDIYSKELDWDYVTNWTINDCWFDSFYGMLLLTDHVYRALFGDALIPEMAYQKLSGASKRNSRLAKKLIEQYDEKLSLPVKIPIITVASHYVRKIVADPHTPFLKKIGTILSISKDFLKRKMPIRRDRPAFPICFVGQDGTGKTIHARYIEKELKQRDIHGVKYIWSRGTGQFLGPLLNFLRFALRNGEMLKEHTNGSRGIETLLRKEPLKSIWAYVLLADHLAKSMKVKLALAFGNMVICDRYIFDTFVDVKCDLGKNLSEALKKTVERLAPKPEIIFMMDTEPRELIKRRPKMKQELVERKRSAYLEYLHIKDELCIIDTCDDLQRNGERILTNTLQTLYRYYP
jgi:thymidylate kinase